MEAHMATTSGSELLAIIERFYAAYNEMDLDTFGALVTEDVHWEHHNRFKGKGREPLLDSVRDTQAQLPVRRFGEITRWAANENVVYVDHLWSGTPAVDIEGWGWKAGVPMSMDCASVFVFEDGRVKEWSDYA
jgi:ketosteroid isomerase-like protein